jgi:alkylation response protein AidB-like acyl-CoA dehydrogenase
MTCYATENGDGYVINGRKPWITNSVVAGWVSVLVRAGSDGDRASMFLVDLSSPGVRVGVPESSRAPTSCNGGSSPTSSSAGM